MHTANQAVSALHRNHPLFARLLSGRALRVGLCVLLFAVTMMGCGSAFTGGGIPIGRSVVRGQVIIADNPTQPIANAYLTLKTSTISAQGQFTRTYNTYSDANGRFAFTGDLVNGQLQGLPTGNPTSNVVLTTETMDGLYRKQTVSFLLSQDRPTNAIVALPSVSFDVTQIASVRMVPLSLASGTSDTSRLQVQVLDHSGNVLPIVPTLLFDGRDGVLGPNNTVTAVGTTIGTVYANIDTGQQEVPSNPIVIPATTVKTTDKVSQRPPK